MNEQTNASAWGYVFGISIVVTVLFVIWGSVAPIHLKDTAETMLYYSTHQFGWFYLLSVICFILFGLYLAFGRYGNIKLGRDDSQPEFRFFTWIGMLFSAGFGVGLVFWGVAEPMSHYAAPPLGLTPETPETARVAMQYSMFHWGIHQWSVFTIVGLIMCYFHFRKQYDGLISATFVPLLGERRTRRWAIPIDTLAVIATAMGVATSLGMGILQINGGIHYLFNVPNDVMTQLIITVILLFMYLISATTGLKRGIKLLSNLNLSLTLGLLLFVVLLGPTVYIMNSFTTGLGEYIQHFVQMSFRLTPWSGRTWVLDWTVFYWAWAIAWAPFVGAFIARISRGRTIKEFVLGVMFVPPFVAVFWMAAFGGTALELELEKHIPIAASVQNDVSTALFVMLEQLPLSFIISLIAVLLIFTFLVTSADSATYVLASMTSGGSLHPKTSIKIIWGVVQAAIAAVLLVSSGLQGLQTASLVAALPFTIIMILMCISFMKALQAETIRKK